MCDHPAVTEAIEALRRSSPALVAEIEVAHPHLLRALVSDRLPPTARKLAQRHIEVDGDIKAAKTALGVTSWLEARFCPAAMGHKFLSRHTSHVFDAAIRAALRPGMDAVEQAACLLVMTDALMRSTETAALTLIDAHRQVYDVTSAVISPIAYVLWAIENPGSKLDGLIRGPIAIDSRFGAVAADTLGTLTFALGYLFHGSAGPRPLLPAHSTADMSTSQVCLPAEACALAVSLGPAAYDLCAAGHLGEDMWTIAVRGSDGVAMGVARIDQASGALRVGRIVSRDGAATDRVLRLAAEETIRLFLAAGVSGGDLVPPPQRIAPDDVIETRWEELTSAYRATFAHIELAHPLRPFDAKTVARLRDCLELLRGIASRV